MKLVQNFLNNKEIPETEINLLNHKLHLSFVQSHKTFMFNVIVLVFVCSVAPSLRHTQAVLIFIFHCVCVCLHECTCVRVHAWVMCRGVGTCAMVHTWKPKGQPQGLVLACSLVWDRAPWAAWAWLLGILPFLPPSPYRNPRIADTQCCAWLFVGPGDLSDACRASSL